MTAKRQISMIIAVVIVFLPSLSLATDVGGIIDTDTTWGLAGSPYTITLRVQVAEGVTLTIMPGVEVNIEGNPPEESIEIWGNLSAIGT